MIGKLGARWWLHCPEELQFHGCLSSWGLELQFLFDAVTSAIYLSNCNTCPLVCLPIAFQSTREERSPDGAPWSSIAQLSNHLGRTSVFCHFTTTLYWVVKPQAPTASRQSALIQLPISHHEVCFHVVHKSLFALLLFYNDVSPPWVQLSSSTSVFVCLLVLTTGLDSEWN